MNRYINKVIGIMLGLVLITGFTGCSMIKEKASEIVEDKMDSLVEGVSAKIDEETDGAFSEIMEESKKNQTGLPDYFTKEFPVIEDADIIDYQEFNGNHFSVVMSINEDYEEVLKFYVDALDLDDDSAGKDSAYYEGIETENTLIQGLTIEETDAGTNVFVTLKDYAYEGEESDMNDEEEASEDVASDGIITYENMEEQELGDDYPYDAIPIYPGAKILDSSLVPGKPYGFVELILPPDAFSDAVDFYTQSLDIEPRIMSAGNNESADFKGVVEEYKVTLMISHVLTDGNDPYIQIVIDEKN